MKYVKLFFSYRARQFEKYGFEKNAFKVSASESRGRTWRDKKIHDFHNFSNSGLKFHMRISECICNRIMMKKKYRFFDPFTGEAPLKLYIFRCTHFWCPFYYLYDIYKVGFCRSNRSRNSCRTTIDAKRQADLSSRLNRHALEGRTWKKKVPRNKLFTASRGLDDKRVILQYWKPDQRGRTRWIKQTEI